MKSYQKKIDDISKIAMWGPSGSGKSWLIHAFGKTLLKYSMTDTDFLYEITDKDGRPLDFYSLPNVKPTATIEDQTFLFRRRGKKISEAHRISSHSHHISIVDNKGSSLSSLSDMATFTSLMDSPNIILLLDTSLQQREHFLHIESGADKEDLFDIDSDPPILFTPEEYKSLVAKLLQLLSKSISGERHIAVCLTKVDLLRVRGRNPTELVRMFFGADMYSLFREYSSIPNINIEFFSVSSAGFIRDSNEIKSNFDFSTGNLLKTDMWEPFNVEAPFFWFFENIERKRIAESGGLFASKLFGNSRLKNYIPYPIRRF